VGPDSDSIQSGWLGNGSHSLLCNGYLVFPGGKAAGTWRSPPTATSAEFKERIDLYRQSPSESSWIVFL